MQNIGNILAASDLSAASEVVIRGAAALAALTAARLHVLHVYDFHPVPYLQSLPPATFHDQMSALQAALAEQVERTARSDVDVASREVTIDAAHKAILHRAELVSADLIVIGRHRARRIADTFLGGTADNIVRSAPVPVLIVPDAFRAPLRRVLVAVDLSEPALHALDVAVRWVSSLGSADSPPEIIVLHVIPQVFDFQDSLFDSADISTRLQGEIAAARGRGDAAPGLRTRAIVRVAQDVADDILGLITQEEVDLAVLGTHGYGALKRALIGSVSSRVARTAGCPVLLVPPAMAERE